MPHRWDKDDEIIAIDAHFRIQDGKPRDAAISQAVRYVNQRTQRDGAPLFNNHNSMKMKMQNLAYLQNPNAPGTLGNVARKTIRVWETYANDRDGLAREMRRICESFKK